MIYVECRRLEWKFLLIWLVVMFLILMATCYCQMMGGEMLLAINQIDWWVFQNNLALSLVFTAIVWVYYVLYKGNIEKT